MYMTDVNQILFFWDRMFIYSDIEEKYNNYLNELKKDVDYSNSSPVTCTGIFVHHDKALEDLKDTGQFLFLNMESATIDFEDQNGNKELMSPKKGLDTILKYHMMHEPHQNVQKTIEELKKYYILVPEEVVAKVIGYCQCDSEAIPLEISILKEFIW